MKNSPYNMINLIQKKLNSRWVGFFIISMIFILTIWISIKIVRELKIEEKAKIENYARSLELISSNEYLDSYTQDFLFKIIEDNRTIPVVLIDDFGHVNYTKNISSSITDDPKKLDRFIERMKKENQFIEIDLPEGKNYAYFKNSTLLTQLQYYPLLLVALISLFLLFSYWYFNTIRETEKSFLWAGMAKETAHQIGTPLSSLMGWVELLKLEEIDQTAVLEIEKDVYRLNEIAQRFSKIGSIQELKNHDIVTTTQTTVRYIQQRISKGIEVSFTSSMKEAVIPLNPSLFSWVIENLMKNAADAMQNKGYLSIDIREHKKGIAISLQDTGPGISPKLQKKIFDPGFTTKKRGWGLGLSLAKRIIEDYHDGKIFVSQSSKEKGTEFIILLKKYK